MRVYLDGTMIGTGETLGDALALAAQVAGHRFVVDARADGQEVPADHLANPPEESTYADDLTLTTADPVQLVAAVLTDAATALSGLGHEQSAVAELIQIGETSEAMDRLSGVIGIWQQVDHTVRLAHQTTGISLGAIDLDEATESLATHLGAIRTALQAGDLTSVADILAYDMDGLPERWSILLREAADRVEGACAEHTG
jgi:hypothetical protein